MCVCSALTEVESHANKDDETEPGAEVRHKIDDGNDDVNDSGYNAEHNIAATQTKCQLSNITTITTNHYKSQCLFFAVIHSNVPTTQ